LPRSTRVAASIGPGSTAGEVPWVGRGVGVPAGLPPPWGEGTRVGATSSARVAHPLPNPPHRGEGGVFGKIEQQNPPSPLWGGPGRGRRQTRSALKRTIDLQSPRNLGPVFLPHFPGERRGPLPHPARVAPSIGPGSAAGEVRSGRGEWARQQVSLPLVGGDRGGGCLKLGVFCPPPP